MTRHPRLLDRVRERLRLKHYSIRTEQAYMDILFHGKRHPDAMGNRGRALFEARAVQRNVAASTQNQALSAIVVLYKEVLGRELEWLYNVERAKRPARVPVVLTEAEVRAVLAQMDGRHAFMAGILYGAGLRLMECVRLGVKDVDFGYSQITVRDGKGEKDRVTILQPCYKQTSWAILSGSRWCIRRTLKKASARCTCPSPSPEVSARRAGVGVTQHVLCFALRARASRLPEKRWQ